MSHSLSANMNTKLARLYDNNDFKRGLKEINKELRGNSKNAELLAWKAMFNEGMKNKKEALDLIKEALRLDMKSAIVWKFNGLINKDQGNYTKAAQALTLSRKYNPNDSQVLSDLCSLYLYERNYSLLLEASTALIKVSGTSGNVIRYALALELSGNVEIALHFLSTYEDKLMRLPTASEDELLFRSELSLYHLSLFLKLEKYQDCLAYFDLPFPRQFIRDSVQSTEIKVKCYQHLDISLFKMEDLQYLIHYYPENGDYFAILEDYYNKTKPADLINVLLSISEKEHSRYALVRSLELMDVTDERFKPLCDSFIRPLLIKGSPAIYINIREFSVEKLNIVEEMIDSYELPLSSIPIRHLFHAQILRDRCEYDKALEEINKGLEHTPTATDLLGERVRILKHAGRITEYEKAAEEYYEAEPADRNANNMYAKASVINGHVTVALFTVQPFSRDPQGKDRFFATEFNEFHFLIAETAARAGDYITAERGYTDVVRHFQKYKKDEFNYSKWGLRKIHSYREMIQYIDDLNAHPLLGKAITNILLLGFSNNLVPEKINAKSELEPVETPEQLMQNLAKKGILSKNNECLAYTVIYYVKMKKLMPALKCWIKLNKTENEWRFAAEPLMIKMMKNQLDQQHPLVKEVALQYFKEIGRKPQSFLEMVAAASGLDFADEKEAAKQMLLAAVDVFDGNFKNGLRMIKVAKQQMKDEDLVKLLKDKVASMEKYSKMELEFEKYLPFPFPSQDKPSNPTESTT